MAYNTTTDDLANLHALEDKGAFLQDCFLLLRLGRDKNEALLRITGGNDEVHQLVADLETAPELSDSDTAPVGEVVEGKQSTDLCRLERDDGLLLLNLRDSTLD